MPEPAHIVGNRVLISPDNPARHRTWPDPRGTVDARWKAHHNPDTLTVEEIRSLAAAAGAYAHIFEIPQRTFAPSHAAIRAVLAHAEEAS